MAYTTPKTWAVGDVLTASDMNTYVRDNMAWVATDRPHARVFISTSTTITSGATTFILYDSEYVDVGGMHSTTTNTSRLTIPTGGSGSYLYGACIEWDANATGNRQVSVQANGTTPVTVDRHASFATDKMIETTVGCSPFTAGDYLENACRQTTGGNLAVNSVSSYYQCFWAGWYST